jgi:Asp-tRNA(Asn)/Glu-tRNA(Gln) amidotransferase A subunit family amidase
MIKFIHKNSIPIIVKDNIDVRQIPTTGGIKALRYSVPNIDASVIEKLRVEGAIVIAKANLAELASGKYESELGGSCRVRI